MPICDNNKPSVVNQLTEVDANLSEANTAKVKKTKEQAYFNSYDFDAIEVLPSDDDNDVYNEHNRNKCNNINKTNTNITCKSCQTPSNGGNINHNKPVIDYSQKLCRDQKLTNNIKNNNKNNNNNNNKNNSHLENGVTRFKTNYLQRLSSFFVAGGRKTIIKNERPTTTIISDNASCSTKANSHITSPSGRNNNCSTVDGILATPGKDEQQSICVNNDFLLPRAMLKGSIIGVLHSLPMATIETVNGTQLNKNLIANSKISHLSMTDDVDELSTKMATTITTISTTISTPIENCNKISANNHRSSNKNNKNKINNANKNNTSNVSEKKTTATNSGFVGISSSSSSSTSSSSSSTSKSSSSSNSSMAGLAVKCSDDSTSALATALLSSTSLSTSSMGSAAAVVQSNQSIDDHIVTQDDFDIDGSQSTTSSSGAGTSMGVQCYDKSSSISPIDGNEDNRGNGDPINSHSHYSTEKSGSSGYYSSNVCSTYSVEDHIYCEPVIDVMVLNKCGTKLGQSSEIIANNVAARKLKIDSETEQVKINKNLRILETSIENLDRHLRSYPKTSANDRIASFVISNQNNSVPLDVGNCFATSAEGNCIGGISGIGSNSVDVSVIEKHRYGHLPTIMEGRCSELQSLAIENRQKSWQDELIDDSLMDIDLDSFLLVKEKYNKKNKDNKNLNKTKLTGIDNPIFDKSEILNQEDMENNYKCAKYINSCPEDAYKIESETGSSSHKSLDHFLKKYEDQVHFQNTRELLEDVRDKIRVLSESTKGGSTGDDENIPKELESTITTLKTELESYLHIINRNSEMEIRQFCSGLVKNENIVKLTNAFERHKSHAGECVYDFAYEPIHNRAIDPFSQTGQFRGSSIRCTSDPNFKMKRKALTDIFPRTEIECYTDMRRNCCDLTSDGACGACKKTQLQRNLSFHKPILNQSFNIDQDDDKDSILEWHKNKPSIWEMYYGSKRLNQTLLGKRGLLVNDTQAITSYPSSRPESDFTLDLPRAEQLRIKMAKEKKFRQRCRFLTTFLCLVFFLLTVMVVSLVLTRGKRMFGSML